MKRIKRLLCLLLVACTVFSAVTVSADAAGTACYDANKAIECAKGYVSNQKLRDKLRAKLGRAPECADLVNVALNAGGCPIQSTGCSSMVKELKKSSFSSYGSIVELKLQTNGNISAAQNKGKLSAGDPVFYYCPNEKDGCPYVHVVLYSGDVDSNGNIKCYAFNSLKNNEVISYKKCGYCGGKITKAYAFHFTAAGTTSESPRNTSQSSQTTSTTAPAKKDPVLADLKTGIYYNLVNKASGKYLNVYGSRSGNNVNVDVYAKDGTSGEKFKLTKSDSWCTITPACATSYRVNVYGYSSKNGSNVCLWKNSGHSTQGWLIEAVDGGYIIRSADNTNLVLTATGKSNSSNVKLASYCKGSSYQIWSFKKA